MENLRAQFEDWYPIILYAIAAVTGMIGGCAAGGHQLLRGKQLKVAVFIAYGIVGLFLGLLFLAYANYTAVDMTFDKLIGSCLLSGFAGSVVLASTNFTARWVLRRLGIEVTLDIKSTREAPHD
jgi:uncharacterized YccA/Bax inhibitor family protein